MKKEFFDLASLQCDIIKANDSLIKLLKLNLERGTRIKKDLTKAANLNQATRYN
jgi:hypothetical protein